MSSNVLHVYLCSTAHGALYARLHYVLLTTGFSSFSPVNPTMCEPTRVSDSTCGFHNLAPKKNRRARRGVGFFQCDRHDTRVRTRGRGRGRGRGAEAGRERGVRVREAIAESVRYAAARRDRLRRTDRGRGRETDGLLALARKGRVKGSGLRQSLLERLQHASTGACR